MKRLLSLFAFVLMSVSALPAGAADAEILVGDFAFTSSSVPGAYVEIYAEADRSSDSPTQPGGNGCLYAFGGAGDVSGCGLVLSIDPSGLTGTISGTLLNDANQVVGVVDIDLISNNASSSSVPYLDVTAIPQPTSVRGFLASARQMLGNGTATLSGFGVISFTNTPFWASRYVTATVQA